MPILLAQVLKQTAAAALGRVSLLFWLFWGRLNLSTIMIYLDCR